MAELDDRLELAVAIALEASAIPRQYFLSDELVVDQKADDSPVTIADRNAEALLRKRIEAACPDDAIFGEEFPAKDGTTGFKWHLDPIDGTQSFIRGVPLFGTMVALEQDDEPVIGVIAFPALGEIIYAARGSGAWWAINAGDAKQIGDLDRRAARVSSVADLADAAMSNSAMELFPQLGISDRLAHLLAKTKVSRGWSDCYGHLLVATGRLDLMVDPRLAIWDAAALKVVVEEAGGTFTDLSGRATHTGGSGMSTNRLLFDSAHAITGASTHSSG